jgi:SWI/SNF-related matrix-associated actin-dependent regulator 1 of chromatin subfamily A
VGEPCGPGRNGRRRQATDASRAATVEALPEAVAAIALPTLPEGLALLPYQAAGCRAILASESAGKRGWLLGDEMGLGKTIQALVLTQAWATAGRPALVVCPASLRLNWRAESRRWRPGARIHVVANGKDPIPTPEDVDLVIVSYEGATKRAVELMARPWDVLVCDESHAIKNRLAKRTKAICGSWDKENGHTNGLADVAGRTLLLTGTPILNRPCELWTTLEALGLARQFGGWMCYAKRYCAANQVWTGTKMVWDFSGALNLEQLQTRLRASGQIVRRLKADVLTELPAKRRQIVTLEPDGSTPPLTAEERDLLAALERAWIAQVEELDAPVGYDFEAASRIRRKQAERKVSQVLTYVTEALETVDSLVLFAHHRDVIDSLADGLAKAGIAAVRLYGGMSDEDKNAAVEAFQAGKARVFVGSILAAGMGLTLTRASTVVFAELDWRPAMLLQAEDRCHRIGQKDAVLSQILVVEGTFDAYLARMIADKMANIEKALDRDATIPYDEQVMATEQERISRRAEAEARAQADAEAWAALSPEERDAMRVKRVAKARRDRLGEDRLRRLGLSLEDADRPCDPALADAIAEACGMLASSDQDHAMVINNVGFSKADSWYGHAIARVGVATQGQAKAALAMLRTYSRTQLPAGLVERLGLAPAPAPAPAPCAVDTAPGQTTITAG